MAYDEARQRVVLFGWNSSALFATRTWEWDGTDWVDKTPAPPAKTPKGRIGAGVVYDSVRKKVVLFGGNGPTATNTGTEDYSDTWEWDGKVWVEKKPATSPPGRYNPGIAFDPAHGQVLLQGGNYQTGNTHSARTDTWTWNGTNWTKRTPATVPPEIRDSFSLAYHPGRKQILLYGGGYDGGGLIDTWEWNTSNWFKRTPAHNPGVRVVYGLAGAGGRGRVVLFGGTHSGYSNEVWEWSGTDWEHPTITGSSPLGRALPAIVYDAARGEYVMFGGYSNTRPGLNDTWVLHSRGSACGDVSDCDAVACVDGVCCDRACDGSCEACNVEGKVGTCSPVTGAPVGARSCSGTGTCAGKCDGTKATCTYPTSATACGATTCVDDVRTSFACDGAGACKTSTTSCPTADAGAEDAGEPDAGEPDAGEPDAGREPDAPDAGRVPVTETPGDASAGSADAGVSGGDAEADSGCSCNSASDRTGRATGALALALAVLALRRPRRRRSSAD
jgi:MYXO-CTERM domain-containing protein